MIDYHKTVPKLFDAFYNKFYKTNFRLDLSINNQKKQVDNFIKLLGQHYQVDTLGINFLVEYFSFAFCYWKDKNVKRKIALNWIIGKKIFSKWLVRDQYSSYFYQKFLHEYSINIDDLKQQLFEDIQIDNNLDPAEEIEKDRFKDEARLYHCIINTNLYNHKSSICMSCSNKVTCKGILQQRYPRLYKARGYK